MSNVHVGLRILTNQSEETSLNMWGIQPRQTKNACVRAESKKKKERERDETNQKP